MCIRDRVVPALSSTLLRTTSEKGHPLFDKVLVLYEKALSFCLRFKACLLYTSCLVYPGA